MDLGFISAINGIRAALTRNDVRSNNIANVNSKGFKSSRADQVDSGTSGPAVKAVNLDLSQGGLAAGHPADISIEGRGFFQVESESGKKSYTRSLNLHISGQGRISDQNGNAVSGLQPNIGAVKNLQVGEDGTVTVVNEQGNTVQIGKLMVMDFRNAQGLKSGGNGYYEPSSASGPALPNSGQARVLQSMEERSNVDLADQVVGQMTDGTAVKASINAIKAQDEMLGDILDLKG